MKPTSGAALLAEAIANEGVTRAFGVPGQRVLPLFDELQNRFGVDVVLTRHEQGAAYMADMHARVAGFGCCIATSGPGGINLLGGIASAYMDSIPMLAVTAQASTDEFGKYGIQEGTGLGRTPDIRAMVAATAKMSVQPMSASELAEAIPIVLASARSGRPGPVHLDIPSDLLLADCLRSAAPPHVAGHDTRQSVPDDQIVEALAMLRAAERPLILVGNGVARADAMATLEQLADSWDVPMAGTFMAKTLLDERNERVLGPIGIFGRAAANHALHVEADLVLSLGVAFSYLSTVGWPKHLQRSLIRVDIDSRELSNNYAAQLQLHGDIASVLEQLGRETGGVIRGGGLERARELRERFPDETFLVTDEAPYHPGQVVEVLDSVLDDRTTVVSDVGQFAYWVERYLHTYGKSRFLINGGLGAMGHGVAGALGAALSMAEKDPLERVICVCGDGGFMMGGLEVSTAVEAGANITWLVMNNRTLANQRAWFERMNRPVVASDMPMVDFAAMARSMGAEGIRVDTLDDLRTALARRDGQRCAVIEVPILATQPPTAFEPPTDSSI